MCERHVDDIAELEKLCFSMPWSRKSILYEVGCEYAHFYVAVVDGKVVGYAGMHIYVDEGIIANVCTHPDYTGNGIGQRLVSVLSDLGRKKALAFLTLEVRVSNECAKHIYRKYGFETQSVRKNYYKNPTEDAEIMFLSKASMLPCSETYRER